MLQLQQLSANQTICQVHRLMHLLLTSISSLHSHTRAHSAIQKRQLEQANFCKEWKTRILTDTSVKVQTDDELAKRCKHAKSKVKMSKVRRGKDKVCRSKENDVCWGVKYWAQQHSWCRETWFKCVICGKWAHELCGNLDPFKFMCRSIGYMDD